MTRNTRSPSRFTPVKSDYFVITKDYLIPFLIILLVIALWFVAFKTPAFSVTNLDCKRDYSPCQDPFVISEIEKYKGQNLLILNDSELKTKLLSGNKTIKTVETQKILPHTLSVSLISTSPRVALKVEGDENWVVFDDNLRAITVSQSDPSLPTVIVNETQEVQLGQEVQDDMLKNALSVALVVTENLLKVDSIKLDKDTVVLTLEDGKTALLTTRKDTKPQILTLQAILADDTILEGENYHTIDVRFSQPVLKSD